MKLLVVGGSGQIGRLALPTLAETLELRIFDRVPPCDAPAEYYRGDVCDYDALRDAAAGQDALLYMAMGGHGGRGDDAVAAEAFDANVKGVDLALRAAHCVGIRVVVHLSTMSVFAGRLDQRTFAPDDTPDSTTLYGFTKRLGEEVCRNAALTFGMPVNVLRLWAPVDQQAWERHTAEGYWYSMRADDTARVILKALAHRGGFNVFDLSGDDRERRLSLAKARSLLGWSPSPRAQQG